LEVRVGQSDQEIREVQAGLGSRELKFTVADQVDILFDMIDAALKAELHGVRAAHFGKAILKLIILIHLVHGERRGAESQRVERHRLHTQRLEVAGHDSTLRRRDESL